MYIHLLNPFVILLIGIIALMDEECLRPGEPTDISFLAKINKNLTKHPHFIGHMKADIQTQKTMGRDVRFKMPSLI